MSKVKTKQDGYQSKHTGQKETCWKLVKNTSQNETCWMPVKTYRSKHTGYWKTNTSDTGKQNKILVTGQKGRIPVTKKR